MAYTGNADGGDRTTATAEAITPGQLVSMAFVITVCGTLYFFPLLAITAGGRSGWLLGLPAAALAAVMAVAILRIIRAAPNKLFPDVVQELAGPLGGRIINFIFALLFMLSAAVDYRAASEPIEATFYATTPLWVIVGLLALPSTYLAWTGPVRMARLYPLFAAIITVGLVLALASGLYQWDFGYLLPLTSFSFVLNKAPFWASVLAFRPAFALGFFTPYLSPQTLKRGMRLFSWGLVPGAAFLMLITAIPVAAFGAGGASEVVPPFMTALGTLVIPRSPFTRVEFPIRLLFQANAIAAIAIQQYGAASLLSRAFAFRDNLLGILAASIPPIAVAAWFATDTRALAYIVPGVIIVSAVGAPLLGVLLILAVRRGGHETDNSGGQLEAWQS